jgi:hypothetical protein
LTKASERLHFFNLQVFINPMVAALPEHHHLFAEGGCFQKHDNDPQKGRTIVHRPCGTGEKQEVESKLPDSFLPIKLDASMDEAWEKLVFGQSKGS